MRGIRAKKIRKLVYGNDMVQQRSRTYIPGHEPSAMKFTINGYYKNPTCICSGARRDYKDLKAIYKNNF